jgi:hypothetical protein
MVPLHIAIRPAELYVAHLARGIFY